MARIRNINDKWGRAHEFVGDSVRDCVKSMAIMIRWCGYLPGRLREGVDYEVVDATETTETT